MDKLGRVMMEARMDWRRGRYAAVLALVGAIIVFALGAAPASAATPPTAAFTVSTPDVTGSPITFDASASNDPNPGGSITNYHWDFGDGTTPVDTSSPSITHTYSTPGAYTINLTVTDVETDMATATPQTITVDEPPTAAFTSSPSNPGVGATVSFDGSTSNDPDGTIANYAWDFGDGTTATGATPSHAYTTAGPKTVTLTITDSDGQTNTTTNTVTVDELPSVAFTSSPSNPGVGATVSFDGSTSNDPDGTIASYAWDFGDGTTATGATPSHAYTTAGPKTVTLTITDSDGQTNTTTNTVTVDELPSVAFTSSPSNPGVGATVSFDGSTSNDPDGTIASYAWDFGDGTTATGATPSHAYTTAGTKTVTLTITDSDGQTNTITHTVTVDELPSVAFTSSPSNPGVGATVSFDGSTSNDPDGTIASYSWDFGDGSTTTGATPSHAYTTAGTKTVTLTITDSDGQTNTTTNTVTVYAAPTAAFTPPSGLENTALSFDGSASSDPNSGGSISSYAWNFGDGTTGSGATPTHTYTHFGSYTATLTVTDNYGQTSSAATHTVVVSDELPTPAFTSFPPNPGIGATVSFDGSTSNDPDGTIASYSWDFGDGTTGTGATPSHAYTSAGPRTVTLTITDSDRQTNTITHTVLIGPAQTPTAAFTPPSGLENTALSFDGSGSTDPNPGGTLTSYTWSFGDGSSGSGTTVTHTYTHFGSYTATLTVTDDYGQTSSTTHTVVVTDETPAAAISSTPSSPSVGTIVSFNGSTSSDPDGTISSYSWRFGDGTNANGSSVQHVYQKAGTYTAVLTVIDADGQLATSKQRITVAPIAYRASAPSAVFAAPTGRAGSPVAFDAGRSSDANPGGTLSYRWTFGDGGVGAGVHASHAFRVGRWTVTLTVTDNASGLSNSVSHAVTISAPVCVVPALRGKLLPAARRALQAAHCSLGRVTAPKKPSRSPGKHKRWQLVVASELPQAGRVRAKGAAVRVTLVWRSLAA